MYRWDNQFKKFFHESVTMVEGRTCDGVSDDMGMGVREAMSQLQIARVFGTPEQIQWMEYQVRCAEYREARHDKERDTASRTAMARSHGVLARAADRTAKW
jgi:hypothetical protein